MREGSAVDAASAGARRLGRGGMESRSRPRAGRGRRHPDRHRLGAGRDVLGPIVAGEPRGTRFHGVDRELSAFKLWLRFGKRAPRKAAGRRRRRAGRLGAGGEPACRRRRRVRGSLRARRRSRARIRRGRVSHGDRLGRRGRDRVPLVGSRPCIATASSSTNAVSTGRVRRRPRAHFRAAEGRVEQLARIPETGAFRHSSARASAMRARSRK